MPVFVPDTKPWYASKGIWGSILSALSAIIAAYIVLPDTTKELFDNGQLAEAFAIMGAVVFSLLAWYGRATATKTITRT